MSSTTTKSTKAATPMVAQYLQIKAEHTEYLLFYRMGDFYELFFDDALAAAAALDITLTHRGTYEDAPIPMCGVPFHAAESYLEKLIRAGFKVAICEQAEDPAEAKKRGGKPLLKREVVRLVTAGTLSEEGLLDARAHNFLAAAAHANGETALAWVDMSTGDARVCQNDTTLAALLARLAPSELLLVDDAQAEPQARALAEQLPDMVITRVPPSRMSVDAGRDAIKRVYQTTEIDGLADLSRAEIAALGAACGYLEITQIGQMPLLQPPRREAAGGAMQIDAATRANLELMQTLAGARKGSLLHHIDRTQSAMGGRLLAARLAAPLTDYDGIAARHEAVAFFVAQAECREACRAHFKTMPDMPRALQRLALQRGGPRDVLAVARGVQAAQAVRDTINNAGETTLPDELTRNGGQLAAELVTLATRIAEIFVDEPPVLARDGGFIREGKDTQLDSVRQLRDESRRVIAGLQVKYAEATEIKALKVKHNAVLGYHIDVPSAHGDKLMTPPHNAEFIHRQTLANSARFSTQELDKLAGEIGRAAEKTLALEMEIFERFTAEILAAAAPLQKLAAAAAAVDVAAGLAALAADCNWTRPHMHDDTRFLVQGGRHPVVEAALAAAGEADFIANDCALDGRADAAPRLTLLTGPNMAGKSTFLRQNALLTILAQMGAFVPASRAEIGIVDRVFSRVGASDDLARGRSTFMVEMVETAAILNQAGPRSLVILDEIGRGTATFDGLSIAWASVEYLHDVIGCRALFATHYHEMAALSERLSGLANATMRVKEHDGQVVFLHEVAAGAATSSYGIHVAGLAGLPASVLARAREVLAVLEENRGASSLSASTDGLPLFVAQAPPEKTEDPLRVALAEIDPDQLAPREALELLYRLRDFL